jgi:hypothetical protein
MKLKHPQVFVEIFVDGRYEIHAPTTVKNRREAFSVAALKNLIPVMIREADGKIEPDRYEAFLTGFKLRTRKFNIELIPVK